MDNNLNGSLFFLSWFISYVMVFDVEGLNELKLN